jgi:FkbH-like protein
VNIANAISLANRGAAETGKPFAVFLACSFTPQHLKTFLAAHVVERLPGRKVSVSTGLYGDLISCIRQLDGTTVQAAAVVFEWEDLDPRLGFRSSQIRSAAQSKEILVDSAARLEALEALLIHLAGQVNVSVALPTLPLPPFFATPLPRADPTALVLEAKLAELAVRLAGIPNIRVVSRQRIDQLSNPGQRHDLKSQLRWDFPYQIPHCSSLAQLLAQLIVPELPKKAIITDLDGTLWRGILGEDGVDNISWSLENRCQGHTIYQRMLATLADAGVLIAVATKNDPDLVKAALARRDMVLDSGQLFPIEAHWGPKSQSVERILRIWNVGADSVVFIDDSAAELAEVKNAFSDVTGILYPEDDSDMIGFLDQLRELFGKPNTTEEDRLRSASLRSNHDMTARRAGASEDDFLSGANATIDLRFNKPDQRMFELINKTNQFNLNGVRLEESAWQRYLSDPGTFILGVSYEDKFGPLGTISVALGKKDGTRGRILAWVMSCRAFSRRIEHQVLRTLFEKLEIQTLDLELVATERNGPLREFIRSITGEEAAQPLAIQRERFLSRCPQLFAKAIVE